MIVFPIEYMGCVEVLIVPSLFNAFIDALKVAKEIRECAIVPTVVV